MLGAFSIRARLTVLVWSMIGALALAVGLGLGTLHDRLMQERQTQCRMLVTAGMGHLVRLAERVASGELSEDQAKSQAIEEIAAMSRLGDGYLWINDLSPRLIWHPDSALVGRDVGQWADPSGKRLFLEFVDETARGGAFVGYLWPRRDEAQPVAKISYVERFTPWGWVLGSGLYVDDLNQSWRQAAWGVGVAALVIAAFAALLAHLIARGISGPVGRISQSMRRLAEGEDVAIPLPEGGEIGELIHAMGVFKQSLAEREAARQAHDRISRQARTVFDSILEGVLVTDSQKRIVLVNPAFTHITGYQPQDVMGKDPSILSSGKHDRGFYQAMYGDLTEKGCWQGEVWNRTKSGEIYPESLNICALKGPDGLLEGYVATMQNIAQQKRREARIRWQAEHDRLTGLANRVQFESILAAAMHSRRADGSGLALLYLDLDGFKPINDQLGHGAGDKVLRRVARRIKSAVRASDLVARIGGDEFAIIVQGAINQSDLDRIAAKLLELMADPIGLEEGAVTVGVSIGIALFPHHATDVDQLIRQADQAMYRAKALGRNTHCYHDQAVLADCAQ